MKPVKHDLSHHKRLRSPSTASILLFFTIIFHSSTHAQLDCSNAVAVANDLWPPNHKFEVISIAGIHSPSGDEPTIEILCVRQDEPLNSTGDGNTEWDAQLPSSNNSNSNGNGKGKGNSSQQSQGHVELRRERSGNLNGRFYHIAFRASDSDSSCENTVNVTVAHSPSAAPVDEGPLFVSINEIDSIDCSLNPPPPPPEDIDFDLPNNQCISVGNTFSFPLIVTSGQTSVDFELISGANNMVLNEATQSLNWVPRADQIGLNTFVIGASTSGSAQIEKSFDLLVEDNQPPQIDLLGFPEVNRSTRITIPVPLSDPNDSVDDLTLSLISGEVNMTITENNEFDWIVPDDFSENTASLTLRVTDDCGLATDKSFSISISNQGE